MFDKGRILAIDPALSTTGWAVVSYDEELVGAGKLGTSPQDSDINRIHTVVFELYTKAGMYDTMDVVLEDGFMGYNVKTGLQLASLRGAITEMFNWNGYPVHLMQPAEIRSAFGQKGNASKEEMAEAVRAFYGPENKILSKIGPFSDKHNKQKTSDIYDAISIGLAYIRAKKAKLII